MKWVIMGQRAGEGNGAEASMSGQVSQCTSYIVFLLEPGDPFSHLKIRVLCN